MFLGARAATTICKARTPPNEENPPDSGDPNSNNNSSNNVRPRGESFNTMDPKDKSKFIKETDEKLKKILIMQLQQQQQQQQQQ